MGSLVVLTLVSIASWDLSAVLEQPSTLPSWVDGVSVVPQSGWTSIASSTNLRTESVESNRVVGDIKLLSLDKLNQWCSESGSDWESSFVHGILELTSSVRMSSGLRKPVVISKRASQIIFSTSSRRSDFLFPNANNVCYKLATEGILY